MAKKVMSTELAEIKKLIENKELIIGTKETIKNLKKGNTKKVFLTVNCPKEDADTIIHYAGIASVEIVELDIPNDELGTICRKPFFISVVSVGKDEKN